MVAGENPAPIAGGSGRLQIAEWMASAQNPLTARVMVNRIWKHHFGRGLVRSADNFGKMGEPPTSSRTAGLPREPLRRERLVCQGDASADGAQQRISDVERSQRHRQRRLDPTNKLLQHIPVRRLEAEAIRDSHAGRIRVAES